MLSARLRVNRAPRPSNRFAHISISEISVNDGGLWPAALAAASRRRWKGHGDAQLLPSGGAGGVNGIAGDRIETCGQVCPRCGPSTRTLDLRDAWWSVWLTFTPPPPHHHHQRRATRPPDVDQDAWSTWNHFWHSIEETPGGQLGLNRQPEMRDTPPGVDQDARSAQNSFRRPIEETPGGEFGSSDTFPPHTGSKQIKSFRETRINVPGICSSR